MRDSSLKPKDDLSAITGGVLERRQRIRMVMAVFLLLVAIAVVLLRDPKSRPGSETLYVNRNLARTTVYGGANQGTPSAGAPAQAPLPITPQEHPARPEMQPHSAASTPAKPTVRRGTPHTPVPASEPAASQGSSSQNSSPSDPISGPSITATRAVLPPLEVEVVAGDRHSPVKPGNPSLKVDMQPGTPAVPAGVGSVAEDNSSDPGPLTDASERVQVSAETNQVLTRKVRPEYPLLARQMKVQGSVVLDAMIGTDGGIQDLHVVQGPTILADAAREAVRQWRFKPYLRDGQAVETQAHITVNFMISTN